MLKDKLIAAGIEIAGPGDPHFREGWVNMLCPFCGSLKNHLGLTEDGRRANCYKCGPKHPYQVLRVLLRWSTEELEAFKQQRLFEPDTWKQDTVVYGKYTPPKNLLELFPKDIESLHQRGWDTQRIFATSQLYGLQSIGPFSGYPAGIFIPIKDVLGRLVSWTIRYRIPEPGKPRYHTAKNEEKTQSEKHLLFGENHVREQGLNTIIICEGPFDAMAIGPGAVCVFGLAYSVQQVAKMVKYPRRIVCFDSESHAQNIAHRLCRDLSVFPGHTEQVELNAKDPGSATHQEIKSLKEYAGI